MTLAVVVTVVLAALLLAVAVAFGLLSVQIARLGRPMDAVAAAVIAVGAFAVSMFAFSLVWGRVS